MRSLLCESSQVSSSPRLTRLFELGDILLAGLRIVALWAACASFLSCGGSYFVGFVSNPSGTSTITGVVTTVNSGFIADLSGVTQYTAVTFMNAGSTTAINFCGDQRHLFPIDTTVRAEYTAGIVCFVLVRVMTDNKRASLESLCISDTGTPEHFGSRESI
jgi:hypothetical protein